jgi:hypothetical protein
MYRDPDGATKPVEDINKWCHRRPFHVVFAGVNDILSVLRISCLHLFSDFIYLFERFPRPKRVQQALVDPRTGRSFASITTIEESGHMVSVTFQRY